MRNYWIRKKLKQIFIKLTHFAQLDQPKFKCQSHRKKSKVFSYLVCMQDNCFLKLLSKYSRATFEKESLDHKLNKTNFNKQRIRGRQFFQRRNLRSLFGTNWFWLLTLTLILTLRMEASHCISRKTTWSKGNVNLWVGFPHGKSHLCQVWS